MFARYIKYFHDTSHYFKYGMLRIGHWLKYVLKPIVLTNKTEIFSQNVLPRLPWQRLKETDNILLEVRFHQKATIHGISVKSERCHFPRFPL